MPKNMPFKGSKKLGEEFDPDIVGEDGFDLDDVSSELEIDYSGTDKIEGSGFDALANQQKIEDFGTQTVGRVSGKSGSGYSDYISKASVSKLQSLKGMFQSDKDVLDIIDEEINRRAELTRNTAKIRNVKTGDIVESPMVGQPSGVRGAQIAESAAPKYYTESEIKKGTAFYKEELATIDKYLTEVEDIDPKVRTALAEEAAELETNLEIEKAMFGQPLEEAAAVENVIKAGIKKPEVLADLDKTVNKSGKTVLESMTEDVGTATSKGFVDKTFEQTRQSEGGLSLTNKKGIGKSYVRDMTDLWGETKGILGDEGFTKKEQVYVEKGGKTPRGGTAKTSGLQDVVASFPLDDQQIQKKGKLELELTQAERKLKYLEKLSTDMHSRGLSTPDSASEIKFYQDKIKNTKSAITRLNKNMLPIASSDAARGKEGSKLGSTYLGEIDKGKAFPVVKDTGKAGGYGLTAEYAKELEKAQPGSKIDPKKSVMTQGPTSTGQSIYSRQKDIEFAKQNPRAAAAMKGAPDPGSPLGVNKPASSVKATDLGDIKQSKSYVKKYEEAYPKILKTLIADAGQVVEDLTKADPALIKKAAASAAIIATNFAKRNPNISAGLMLYSGLVNRNKKEEDYFK
jgi:hypothetical protein